MRLLQAWLVVVTVLVSALVWTPSNGVLIEQPRQNTDEAYVTLLYGNEFLLGVRVLGKSIRDTGTSKDMVALVTDGVSDFGMKLLEADGWIVTKVSLVENPNSLVRPKRLWGVYTKLKIFNMTNYKKVVYLDADTIVVKSIENIFKCGKFCAILKHSERMNSGVMVIEPSQKVFDDMISKVHTLESYTGGEQGFLESYYPQFAESPIFQPNLPQEFYKSKPVPKTQRIPTIYNADVGQFLLSNKWKVRGSENISVFHFTLGPLKPWDWWTSWIMQPVDLWQNIRDQLPESLPGTGGGSTPNDHLTVKFLFLLPFCALLLLYYRSFLQTREYFSSSWDHIRHLCFKVRSVGTHTYAGVSTSATSNPNQQDKVPVYLGAVSVLVCFMAALVAAKVALGIVPRQLRPWSGLLLMYEWTLAIFFLLFGCYLHLIYLWGKATSVQSGSVSPRSESLDYDSGKGHLRLASSCDNATRYYGLGVALLTILVPCLPCFLGFNTLLGRLVLMAAGGLVLGSFMTYASDHLAIRTFLRGLEDRDAARSKDTCYFC